ncbi:hypothetical protein [Ramlibacter sp.]|uniref:hypothetical protein n=1 Tax=Ramlibacter sp. TaxID=1917967 RepID=UPI0035B31A28
MKLNPELRRYAWLELNLHRLVVVPVVIAALATLLLLGATKPAEPLAFTALGLFMLATVVWGSLRTIASVTEEVRERTWDFQRMAAVPPLQLALGKMLGAPLLYWYIGFWALLVYGAAGTAAGLPDVPLNILLAVALALLLHALGVSLSALLARAGTVRNAGRWGGLLLLILAMYLVPAALVLLNAGDKDFAGIGWWLIGPMGMRPFLLLSLLVFAAWAVLGAWRAMARELREPAWWWAWPAFAAFTGVWLLGIRLPASAFHAGRLEEALGLAALVLVGAGYLGLLLDPYDPVRRARLARLRADPATPWHGRWPHWLLHGGLAVVVAALATLIAALREPASPGASLRFGLLGPVSLAAAAMFLRDAAIVTCFTLAARTRRPVGMAAFYLVLASTLLPGLLGAMGLDAAITLVQPFIGWSIHPLVPAAGFAAHLVIALLVLMRWLRRPVA